MARIHVHTSRIAIHRSRIANNRSSIANNRSPIAINRSRETSVRSREASVRSMLTYRRSRETNVRSRGASVRSMLAYRRASSFPIARGKQSSARGKQSSARGKQSSARCFLPVERDRFLSLEGSKRRIDACSPSLGSPNSRSMSPSSRLMFASLRSMFAPLRSTLASRRSGEATIRSRQTNRRSMLASRRWGKQPFDRDKQTVARCSLTSLDARLSSIEGIKPSLDVHVPWIDGSKHSSERRNIPLRITSIRLMFAPPARWLRTAARCLLPSARCWRTAAKFRFSCIARPLATPGGTSAIRHTSATRRQRH